MKKTVKILTMLLAALLVGLLLVTACTNPTNGDPGTPGKDGAPGVGEEGKPGEDGEQGEQGEAGGTGPEGKPGLNIETINQGTVNAGLLTTLYGRGVDTVVVANPATLTYGLDYVIPQNKTLVISGSVSLSGGTSRVNAINGTFDLTRGTLAATGGDIILLNDKDTAAMNAAVAAGTSGGITGATVLPYKASITEDLTGDVATSSLTFETAAAWTAFVDHVDTHTVYVAGDFFAKNVGIDFSATNVVVYGDLKAQGNVDLEDLTYLDLGGSLVATNALTLGGINNFTGAIDTGSNLVTVDTTGGITSVALANLYSSSPNGKLVLNKDIAAVNITGNGNGNIEFATSSPNDPVELTTAAFGNTGATTFNQTVEISTNDAEFAGSVRFAGDLTLTDKGVTFNNPASFAAGKITLVDTTYSVITLDQNGAVSGSGGALTYTAGSAVTIKAAVANTILTFDGTGITQSGGATHSIVIADSAPTLTGTYTVASLSTAIGTLTTTNGLNVTGKLALTGAVSDTHAATLVATAGVVAGGTTFVGSFQPVGAVGIIDIEPDKITASVATVALTPAAGATITIDADKRLTVSGTINIAASTGGSAGIILTGNTNTASILLKGGVGIPGSLVTGGGVGSDVNIGASTTAATFKLNDTTPYTALVTLEDGTRVPTSSNSGIAKAGQADASGSGGIALGSISGVTSNNILITGDGTNDVVIDSAVKVEVPNS
jgi:hypothetical protein